MQYKALIIFICLLFLVSCSSAPLSARIDAFVAEVEMNHETFTSEDWEAVQYEYELLLQEYEVNYSTYSSEEKDAINKAIGKFNGLLVRRGIRNAESAIQELGERLPSLIEGFMGVFEE